MNHSLDVVSPGAVPEPDDVVAVVDYVIATACSMAPSHLTARRQGSGSSDVSWLITRGSTAGPEELCRSPSELFRSCLARIGAHYLEGQLYGGYGRRWLRVGGSYYAAAVYLSNEALSGFWVDIYLAPLEQKP
jgi:hypothetical protein